MALNESFLLQNQGNWSDVIAIIYECFPSCNLEQWLRKWVGFIIVLLSLCATTLIREKCTSAVLLCGHVTEEEEKKQVALLEKKHGTRYIKLIYFQVLEVIDGVRMTPL